MTDEQAGPGVESTPPAWMPERSVVLLWAAVAVLWAGLFLFSQTLAWDGDEGFHLLAAQLITAGKKPYLDFFYQHVPLHIYITAGWFRLFGDTWRSAHALATVFTGSSLLLVAGFVYSRIPDLAWRVPAAIAASVLVGLHAEVIQNGTVGVAYGLCLFLTLAGFRLVIVAVDRASGWAAAGAGLCAGAAANASLLTAPVAPILLLWMISRIRIGHRWAKAAWFLAGAVIACIPFLWLAAQGPRQTFFDVVEYHVLHRQSVATTIAGMVRENLGTVYTVWLESTQGLVLVLLAIVGGLFLAGRTEWDPRDRAEMALCTWLALGLGVYLSVARHTHPMYFVLVVPFLSLFAAFGVYAIGSRIGSLGRPTLVMLLVLGWYGIGLVKPASHVFRDYAPHWPVYDEVAQTINRVTPAGGEVWAYDEFLYFAARRIPPPGLGNLYSQSLSLPPSLAADLRVKPLLQLEASLAAGRYATAVVEPDEQAIARWGLTRLYRGRTLVRGYEVFWGRVGTRTKER